MQLPIDLQTDLSLIRSQKLYQCIDVSSGDSGILKSVSM